MFSTISRIMKIPEILFEGPYHHNQDYAPIIKMDSYPSLEGLQRENFFLGLLEKEGKDFRFWLSKSKGTAKVSVDGTDELGQRRQLIVTSLVFHKFGAGLPVDNELQVHTVYTHQDYRGLNLSMALYVVLCRYGYTVVSDFEQYNGGKALWKKMSQEADARRFTIRIWSDLTSDWVTDENGNPLSYNGANLEDDEVWNDLDRHMEPTTLLVLSH